MKTVNQLYTETEVNMDNHKTTFKLDLGKNIPQQLTDPEHGDVKYFDVLVTFREAAKLVQGNANVRLPKKNARTIKAMLETVEKSPGQFHLRNRGITYHCLTAKIDENKKELSVSVPTNATRKDNKKFGILDGGHTFATIQEVMERIEEFKGITNWAIPFVRIRFLVNIPEDVLPSVVEGLNTSVQVKETSLSEYRNEFEWYKKTLLNHGWKPDTVSYREGESREWSVAEVNQRASCFLKSVWLTTQPINMYKSIGRALRMYLREDMQDEYMKLEDVLTDVVTLPEFIQSRLSASGLLEGKVIERMGFVKRLKKEETRVNTKYPSKVRLNDGILLPMSAAFRELLTIRDGKYEWEVSFEDVYDLVQEELFNVMIKRLKQVNTKVSALASDQGYWYDCQAIVLRGKERIKDGERPKVRQTTIDEHQEEPEAEEVEA